MTGKPFDDMVAEFNTLVTALGIPAPKKLTRRQRIAKKAKKVVLRTFQTFVVMAFAILAGSVVAMVVALAILLIRMATR